MRVLVLTNGVVQKRHVLLIDDALTSGYFGPVPGGALDISTVERPDAGHYIQIRNELRSHRYDAVVLLFKTDQATASALNELDGAWTTPIYTSNWSEIKSHRGDRGVAFEGFEAA